MVYPPNIVNDGLSLEQNVSTEKRYYMSIEGKVYGPYTFDLMRQYVGESRIGPQSLISSHHNTGFKAAQLWPEYALWFQASATSLTDNTQALPSVFIIMADINSGQTLEFTTRLKTLGNVQRLSNDVWIASAQASIDTLRDVLSQTLTVDDRLFIHDSFSNRAGWFNIGEDMDEDIRTLWIETAKERREQKNRNSL